LAAQQGPILAKAMTDSVAGTSFCFGPAFAGWRDLQTEKPFDKHASRME